MGLVVAIWSETCSNVLPEIDRAANRGGFDGGRLGSASLLELVVERLVEQSSRGLGERFSDAIEGEYVGTSSESVV